MTVSLRPVCCSGKACRRTRPTCSSTPWCRTRRTARCCASRDARYTPVSPKPSKANSRRSRRVGPRLLARHCTEAGLVEKAAGLWGKAGQQSVARSALIEGVAQLGKALGQIATLPITPMLRREEIKLQVALASALFHVKGYTSPETIAAFERADTLIEQAEALGEHPEGEDALLRFSVMYGQWTGNFSAGNFARAAEQAKQCLALAEKLGAICAVAGGPPTHGRDSSYFGRVSDCPVAPRSSDYSLCSRGTQVARDQIWSGYRRCVIGLPVIRPVPPGLPRRARASMWTRH